MTFREIPRLKSIDFCTLRSFYTLSRIDQNKKGAPQGFGGSGEKGYLFLGSLGALLIILGELGSKHIL